MKKTLIALFALAACAQAVETSTTTYTPLSDSSDWTLGSGRNRANVVIEEGKLYNNVCNWGQDYAIYTFASPLAITAPAHSLDFSYTFTTNGTIDAAVTLALISTNGQTVVVGMGGDATGYSHAGGAVSFGVTDTAQTIYTFEGVTAAGTLLTMGANDEQTIGGSISLNGEGKTVATFGSESVELSDGFALSKVYISYDCGSSATARPEVSNLQLAYTTPEPATATLSLLALAGLASRRRRH